MPTITIPIIASEDDGLWAEGNGGTTFRSDTNNTLVGEGNIVGAGFGIVGSFFRFVNVPVSGPENLGDVTLRAPNHLVTQDSLIGVLAFYDEDDAQAPTTYEDARNPTLTTSQVAVNEPFGAGPDDDYLVDVKAPFVEVVSRPGWAAGNAVCVDLRSIYSTPDAPPSYDQVAQIRAYDYALSPATAELIIEILNAAPTITVTPTASYNGSFTRLGPNASPATVTFTATDDDTGDQETDALTWEIRTAPDGGGTLVSTGSCTHNVSENASVANSDSGIVEGSNTLYLRVGDGDAWSDDESFTLLCDRTAPTVGTITHSPNPVVET